MESGPSSTRSPLESQVRVEEETLQIDSIARGMRILRWQLIFCLAFAAIGSFAFQTGHFANFPYAWFDARQTTTNSEVIANENVHGLQSPDSMLIAIWADRMDEARGDLASG